MTRRLKRIAPVQAGKVLGILYAVMSLLFAPIFLLAGIVSAFAQQQDHSNSAGAGTLAAGMMIAMAVAFPIIYGIVGFVGGVIGAALYNLIAKWVGGIEFEVEDVERMSSATAPGSIS